MGLLSDEEVDAAANAFEADLKSHKIEDEDKHKKLTFADGFLKGWEDAKAGRQLIHMGEVYQHLHRIQADEKFLISEEDTVVFGTCIGILVGTFEFDLLKIEASEYHMLKVLENANIYLACIQLLQHKPEFQALFNMINVIVQKWKQHVEPIRQSLTREQKEDFDTFSKQL